MQVGDFAALRVAAIEPNGAYLEWGKPKQLLLPRQEQTGRRLEIGERVVCVHHGGPKWTPDGLHALGQLS